MKQKRTSPIPRPGAKSAAATRRAPCETTGYGKSADALWLVNRLHGGPASSQA